MSADAQVQRGSARGRWQAPVGAVIFSGALALSLYAFYTGALDFRMFYAAAQMVRQGKGGELYDLAAQRAFQARYTPYPGLVFNYPPFTAALYIPTTYTSWKFGYLLWCVANMLALGGVATMLRARRGPLSAPANFYGFALLFGPALFTLIQGQTSILVLLAFAAALAMLRQHRPLPAGILLSLALIKPQLALPVFAVAVLQGKWKIVGGWLLGAAGFLIASVAISGWRVLAEYPRFLRTMESLPSTGIKPAYMASLRALYVYARGSEPKLWVLAVITLSALLLASRFSIEGDRGFAFTVVVMVLVAYHLFPHDLVLLLIPLAILIEQIEPARWSTALIAGLWLTPLLLVVLYPRALPLLAVEMLGLLGWILRLETRARDPVIAGSRVP